MAISVTCPSCQFPGQAREGDAHRKIRCPNCGARFPVTQGESLDDRVERVRRRSGAPPRDSPWTWIRMRMVHPIALRSAVAFGGGALVAFGLCFLVVAPSMQETLETLRAQGVDQATGSDVSWLATQALLILVLMSAGPGVFGGMALAWGTAEVPRAATGFGCGTMGCAWLLVLGVGALGTSLLLGLMASTGGLIVAGWVGCKILGVDHAEAGALAFGLGGVLGILAAAGLDWLLFSVDPAPGGGWAALFLSLPFLFGGWFLGAVLSHEFESS